MSKVNVMLLGSDRVPARSARTRTVFEPSAGVKDVVHVVPPSVENRRLARDLTPENASAPLLLILSVLDTPVSVVNVMIGELRDTGDPTDGNIVSVGVLGGGVLGSTNPPPGAVSRGVSVSLKLIFCSPKSKPVLEPPAPPLDLLGLLGRMHTSVTPLAEQLANAPALQGDW